MALNYFSVTKPAALSVAMNSSTTVVPLVDASTFPDPAGPGNGQYTVIIGYGSDREEVCTVTAKSGNNLTVIRGQDSTAATGKNQGDVVVHGVSARDFKSFVVNTDPRLTDARTPTLHAPSHGTAGGDKVTPAMIGATTPADLTAAINTNLPVGSIIMWAGAAVVPNPNWALCNDSVHGSDALQTVLTSAGKVDPTRTPDLRSRFIVGAGSGSYPTGGVASGIGGTGGADSVTLTAAQMPVHTHVGTGFATNVAAGGDATAATLAGPASLWSTGPAGSGAAHENRPPYYALVYLIKKA